MEDLPGLLAVDHVGLAVPDLDAAIHFQVQVLGLALRHREDNAEIGVSEAMLSPPSGPVGGAEVQLVAPLGPESPLTRFLERSGPGLQHLAFRVADLAGACDVLRRRGLRLLYDGARVGTRGSLVNFLHPRDAGGVLVELVQPAAVGRCSGLTAECGPAPHVGNRV